jgi:hypothetical protein
VRPTMRSLGASTCLINICQSPGLGAEVRSLSSVDRVPATYFIGAAAQDVRLEAQLVSLALEEPKGSC